MVDAPASNGIDSETCASPRLSHSRGAVQPATTLTCAPQSCCGKATAGGGPLPLPLPLLQLSLLLLSMLQHQQEQQLLLVVGTSSGGGGGGSADDSQWAPRPSLTLRCRPTTGGSRRLPQR